VSSFQKPSKPPPRPSGGDKPCLVIAVAMLGVTAAPVTLLAHAVWALIA
jgi:hypothetical protein